MATYTSNYAWTKPSGNDQVDISVLNDNLDSQDAIMHKAFTNMAQAFSAASTYAVGDIVLYDNVLYKCHTAVTVAGAWTGSTNWQVYKLSEGGGGGSSLTAGDYIDINAGVISVKKEKGEYSLERYVLQSTGGGAPKLVVKKYIDSELISTNEYQNNTAHVNIDDTLEIWYSYNPYNWHYKLLVDGVDHSAGYEYEFSYEDTTEYPVDFHIAAGDSTDLVTKGDLATVATSGSYNDLTDKLTFDNTPTDGSNNPVKSDGIYDSEKNIYVVMGQMGAKNLIPTPWRDNASKTANGVTFTLNADYSVTVQTVNTGATADTNFSMRWRSDTPIVNLEEGSYIASGCPDGGSNSTYFLEFNCTYNNSAKSYVKLTNSTPVTISRNADDKNLGCGITVKSGTVITTPITFKPMLRLASDTDDTYQPYAKTNKQLTDEIANKVDKIAGKGLSTNDYTNTDKAEVAKVANKADKTATASGETLSLVPTSEGRALLHTAYGMSTQSGTPTPSSPVDIESAKADFRSVGKNMIPYPYKETTKTQNGITFTDNGDGTITANGTATNDAIFVLYQSGVSFLKVGRYILSGCPEGGGTNIYKIQAAKNDWTFGVADFGAGVVLDITNESTQKIQYIRILVSSGQTVSNLTFKPMLRLANVTDETYEPYTKHDTTTDLTLRAIEVTSSDAYNLVRDGKYYIADTLDYSEDNGFVVTRRIKESVIDGSQSITTSYDGHTMTANDLYTASECISFLSPNNRFKAIDGNSTNLADANSKLSNGECIKRNTKNSIAASDYFKNTSMTSASDWTTWLTSNPITVYDILATPTTETITTEQALALLGLKTYDESTTISSQAEPSCTIAVEYAKERLGALALTAYNTAKGNDLRIKALEG